MPVSTSDVTKQLVLVGRVKGTDTPVILALNANGEIEVSFEGDEIGIEPGNDVKVTKVDVPDAPEQLPTTANRISIEIYNKGPATVYIGKSGVTQDTGRPLLPNSPVVLAVDSTVELYAIAEAGGSAVLICTEVIRG